MTRDDTPGDPSATYPSDPTTLFTGNSGDNDKYLFTDAFDLRDAGRELTGISVTVPIASGHEGSISYNCGFYAPPLPWLLAGRHSTTAAGGYKVDEQHATPTRWTIDCSNHSNPADGMTDVDMTITADTDGAPDTWHSWHIDATVGLQGGTRWTVDLTGHT